MICEKCSGKVDTNGKCSLCGYDNSNVQISYHNKIKAKSFRSTRITIFMSIIITLDSILAILLLLDLFGNNSLTTGAIIFTVVALILCTLEIVSAIFILKLKMWALSTYIILCVIGGIIQLFSLNFLPILLKALLLYFIFRNDWEYFD